MSRIVASSPGRCGIIGNPSDGYGGSMISCTLQERAFAEVRPCNQLKVVVGDREVVLGNGREFDLGGDFFDIPKQVLTYLDMMDRSLELRLSTQIPYRSGLAGSSAVYAAVFGALAEFDGRSYSKYQLAEHIHKIERAALGMHCGYQDHYMTVFGGLNYMDFREKEHPVSFDEEIYGTLEPLGHMFTNLPFILAQTGVDRVSGTVLKPIRLRWEDGDEAVIRGYGLVGRLAREGKRALIDGDLRKLGQLMNRNHEVQQQLGASGPANDSLIAAARTAGAYGAKLAGAGGTGGTIIALADNPTKLEQPLRDAGAVNILYPKLSRGLAVETVD